MMNRFFWIAFGTVITVLLGASIYFANAPTELEFNATPSAAQPTTRIAIPEEQLAIIRQSHAALQELAKSSPTTADLLTFYDQNAILAELSPGGEGRAAEKPRTDTWFVVAGDPTLSTETNEAQNGAEFHCAPRVLRLNAVHLAPFARGLLVGHELVHASNCINGHASARASFGDPLWLEEEWIAYSVVYSMLNEHSRGAWSELVAASSRRRMSTLRAQGAQPGTHFFGVTPGDLEAIRKIFGNDLDNDTLEFLLLQLDIHAGLVTCEALGMANGKDERFIHQTQIDFLGAFFRNNY